MSNDLTIKSHSLGSAMQRYQATVDDFDREMTRILQINGTDLRCLEILMSERHADVTPRTIATQLGLTTGSVTTMLDRLERAGYVTRTRDTSDRRKVIIDATPEVRKRAWSMIGPMLDDSTADVTSHFSAAELDLIERFLTRATEVQQRHVELLRGRA